MKTYSMHLLDTLEAAWILFIFLVAFLWVPARLFSRSRNSDALTRLAGNGARMVLCVVGTAALLSRLRALNATTVTLLFAGSLTAAWLGRNAASARRLWERLQTTTIGTLRWIESWSLGIHLLPRARALTPSRPRPRSRVNQWLVALESREVLVAGLAVVLLTTAIMGGEHAVRELRLDQPEQYGVLLHARQLILDLPAGSYPLVFPAVIATTSLLSARDPMQVTRFLVPAAGILTVLATGMLIRACTGSGVACLAAMYCLGAAAFPAVRNDPAVATSLTQKLESVFRVSPASLRATPEFGLGLLFCLVALAILVDWYKNSRNWDSLFDFTCCLVLVGLISRPLLLLLVTGAAVLMIRPMIGLITLVVVCYGLAVYAVLAAGSIDPSSTHAILPIAAAIGIGSLFALTEAMLPLPERVAEVTLLLAGLVFAVMWFPPRQLPRQCLEYDAAARVTQQIAHQFPRQAWVVAAPVEQLSETFGLGAHEDLSGFVEKYQGQVSNSEFRFPDARQDLFIYVEKKPFQIYSREPESVSFPVLMDVTYRAYRSPGGRASLESAALELCESYRHYHSDADIFFEDEQLRVYHIHQPAAETGKVGE
jgi:hypothetical protein